MCTFRDSRSWKPILNDGHDISKIVWKNIINLASQQLYFAGTFLEKNLSKIYY